MKLTLKNLLILVLITPVVLFGQDSLKILTYNIEGMKPGTNPSLRLALIISELRQVDPDIIGLQEINEDVNGDGSDNQGLRIKNALEEYFETEYYYYQQQTHLSWDNEFKEFIGIITKYPVMDQGYHQLVTGVFPRKVVWNQISTPIGEINFFNTHLSFNSGAVRLQQVEQIDNYINTISTENGVVSNILTGDFNAVPQSPVIQYLTEPSTDIYYFSSFQKVNPEISGFTVPSNGPTAKIDFVFYTNKSTVSVDTSYIVMDEPLGEDLYFSDHLGVMSIFNYSNNTGIGNLPQINRKTFILYPNYPNPCTKSTSIDYEIFDKKHVNISLFDEQGRELDILVNEEKVTGSYKLNINCNKYRGNTYFLRMEVDGVIETRKLIPLD